MSYLVPRDSIVAVSYRVPIDSIVAMSYLVPIDSIVAMSYFVPFLFPCRKVERVSFYKYLGVVFDSSLNWKGNTNTIKKKKHSHLHSLRKQNF